MWWANLELNQDSTDYESDALPLSYWPYAYIIAQKLFIVNCSVSQVILFDFSNRMPQNAGN